MRVLVTGAGGFMGAYVVDALHRLCSLAEVIACDKAKGLALDVTDAAAVKRAVDHYSPTHVINLAGIAAIAEANSNPEVAWRVHVGGAFHLGTAIVQSGLNCVLINVGSGMVYGETANSVSSLNEGALLCPLDHYAVSKAAADLALGAMSRKGLRCIRMRPFNHSGPGQSEAFVLSAFAMQIARIEAGLKVPVIRVGRLDSERDFLDARDVAEAYALAVMCSDRIESGTILNVASGKPSKISDLLRHLLDMSRVPIAIEQDPARVRADDIPRVVGDSSLAERLLGWKPHYPFEDTMAAILDDCRRRLKQ